MEQQPNKYANGKIYTIRSHQTPLYYIGSTVNELRKRIHCHKAHYNKWLNGTQHYTSSYDIIKYDDHYIELLENYPCNSKEELNQREGQLIREHKNDIVNKFIAGRTVAEYHLDHKEEFNLKSRLWSQNNAERKKELNKKHRAIKYNCECGMNNLCYSHKLRHEQSDKHITNLMIQTL
jgi:hypothetical protein